MKRFFFGTYAFIVAAIILTIIGTGHFADFYIEHNYPGKLEEDEQNLSLGTFYLIEQELLKVPEAEYHKVLENIQTRFGYPVELHHIKSLQLNDEEQVYFKENRILLREDDYFHLKRLGNTDLMIRLGPFKYLSFKPFEITGLIVITTLTLGLLILGWTSYFWRQLNKIREATSAFGRGAFSARAVVPKYSSLSTIAASFNDMAAQIERLVSSHKQLVNSVSHELRTPISRIRFGLESLRTADSKETPQHLAGIRNDVDELDDLVSELLSYSRFERMESRMNLQPHQLLPWLKEYMQVAQEYADVPLSFTSKTITEDTLVKFDPRQLERAIHNLLQNGNRYASRMIEVVLIKHPRWVEIRVEDDGSGIREEDRERLFDPFVRLDSSRNRENGGYGLGLSIVREIARGHHGTVTVEESILGGAAFSLKIPA